MKYVRKKYTVKLDPLTLSAFVRIRPNTPVLPGPATWNSLPASLRDDQLSVAAFRRLLKTELFARAYDSSLARSWLLLTVRT